MGGSMTHNRRGMGGWKGRTRHRLTYLLLLLLAVEEAGVGLLVFGLCVCGVDGWVGGYERVGGWVGVGGEDVPRCWWGVLPPWRPP